MPDDGLNSSGGSGPISPTSVSSGTTRSFANMLNEKTDAKKKKKFSPWERMKK